MNNDFIIAVKSNICILFSGFFSTTASAKGEPDEIVMSRKCNYNFLTTIIDQHKIHDSI